MKCLLSSLLLSLAVFARGETATNLFGFTGPEFYPIDDQISLLHFADLDGDGLNDLVVANNLRSKISLLYNETGRTNRPAAKTKGKLELNELPPDARFRIDSVPTDERIAALSIADMNGDGRPDLVFYGDGKDLEIIFNQGTNGWSEPKRWHIEDGRMDANALAVGSLNGGNRPDILLLGDNGSFYFWSRDPDNTYGEPVKMPYSGTPKAAQIVDVNGDGKNDLLLVDWDSLTPFRFRIQNASGQLGPEIYFKTQPVHAYIADNLEGNTNLFVASIAQNSDRAEIAQFTHKPAEVLSGAFHRGQFQVLPLGKTDAARRGLLWADVNGDGRADLVVAEPESGQLSVYLQKSDGSLAPPETFPTLAGVNQIVAADVNGDSHPEIFLLSQNERAVGMTQLDQNGRLPFPTFVQLDGRPLLMAIGALKNGATPSLCVIVDKDGRRSLVIRGSDGKLRSQKLAESFKSNPAAITVHDVNQDGLADLVVTVPYEKVKVLLQKPNGEFDEQDIDPPGGVVEQPWLATADVDGDGKAELLLPQKNFLRAVVLEKTQDSTNRLSWMFRVKDQINGAANDSRLTGATAIKNESSRIPSLFLLDAEHRQLTLCERDTNGVWRVERNVDLPVSDFGGLRSVALGGTNVQSIAFLGQNALAWLPLSGEAWEFKALDGYDTPVKDGFLNDIAVGDLAGTGHKDLIFLETAKNYLDIVRFDARKLVPGNRWQVFEAHTFRGSANALPEPREAMIADVTGDRKNDLVVITHDRILVYPQE